MKTNPNTEANTQSLPVWAPERLAHAGTVCLGVVVLIYCAWTLDKGFEITDEAYYLLLAIHASSQKLYVSAQHWITTWFWQMTGSLTSFRAAGMLALLVTAVTLALGTCSVCTRLGILKDRFQTKGVVAAGTVISAMLYASTINFSPCYNLLASAGAYAAAGLVLRATQCVSAFPKYLLYIFAGCALAVEFLCKASAGASTLLILVLWSLAFEKSYLHKVSGMVAIAAGSAAFAAIALLSNTTISDATKAVDQGMQLFRIVQVEAIDVRLIRYAIQFGQGMISTLIAFAIPLVLFSFYAKTRHAVFATLGFLVLIPTLYFTGSLFGGWIDGGSLAPPLAIVALLLMALIISIRSWMKHRKLIALLIGLILLPYSVAMGTGNTLFTQIIVSLAPWGTLMGVLSLARGSEHFSKVAASLIALCFFSTVSLQIVTSGFRPYHLSSPLTRQDEKFTIPELGVVMVDSPTHKFLTDIGLAVKACEIEPGTPFLGLYNIPGVALGLQGSPVLSPWLNNVAQAEFVLRRSAPEDLRSVVVALGLGGTNDLPALPPQISAFPAGYRYCGKATYPYAAQHIQIWQKLGI